MAYAIGIDLGTTNTVAAMVKSDSPLPTGIFSPDGGTITRSMVGYENGTWIVGKPAVELGKYSPFCIIASTKRFIGLNYDDRRIRGDIAALNTDPRHPRVVAPPKGESGVRFRFYPPANYPQQHLSPVEVATMILRHVKQYVSSAVGREVTHATITVPAYFDAARIEATRQAGEAAGLIVQRIISEPLAAALAYGYQLNAETTETVLIFDLGGGTLDVTVCLIGKNNCVELAKDGNNHLGGDDFDARLERLVLQRLREAYGLDLTTFEGLHSENKQTMFYELRNECRSKKELLSSATEVTISQMVWRNAPELGALNIRPIKITRQDFEAEIADYVDEAMQLVQHALSRANTAAPEINKVLLVGGSTFVPVIRERLRAIFGSEKVLVDVNPMEAVAFGAAILASSLPLVQLCPRCHSDQPVDATRCRQCGAALVAQADTGQSAHTGPQIELVSTIARTISVKTQLGNLVPLFKRGAQYSPSGSPSLEQARETFRIAATGTRDIHIEFYEGESEDAGNADNSFYAGVTIPGLPHDVRQGEEVILAATLNGDGSIAGKVTFRGQLKPYIASPSKWRGDLVDSIERARRLLPNVADPAARAQIEQAIEHAEDIVIERTSTAQVGHKAQATLTHALEETDIFRQQSLAPELEQLQFALSIGQLVMEYGSEWVLFIPRITAPALREALGREDLLLSALRSALVEGRQIEAREDVARAGRATEIINANLKSFQMLYTLAFGRLVTEFDDPTEKVPSHGSNIFTTQEWERIRLQGRATTSESEKRATPGSKQQCRQDIGQLLEQMHVTIIADPTMFFVQLQRVQQLLGAFFSDDAS